MTTLRFLLGVVALEDLELLQLDVKTTFLHGDLDEEIYGAAARLCVTRSFNLVCELRKSLYGLKQAPRQRYRKFDDFVRSIGLLRSDQDHCFYSKDAPDGSPIFLILYVVVVYTVDPFKIIGA
jgi:hypothetical protein